MNEYKITICDFAKRKVISTRYCIGLARARQIVEQIGVKIHWCGNAKMFTGINEKYDVFVEKV